MSLSAKFAKKSSKISIYKRVKSKLLNTVNLKFGNVQSAK